MKTINSGRGREIQIETLLGADRGEIRTTIAEFRQVFESSDAIRARLGSEPLCVFMEDSILIVWREFPDLSVWVHDPGAFFLTKDVSFLGNPKLAGTYSGPLRLSTFVKTELRLNWQWLLTSFSLILVLGIWTRSLSMLRSLDVILVTVVAFWVAMFAVVAPGRYQQARARDLFRNGLLYRQFTNDQFLGRTAVVSLVASTLATAVSFASAPTVTILGVPLNPILSACVILTSLSGTLATLCFVSIYKYYLEQAKAVEYAIATREIVEDFTQK